MYGEPKTEGFRTMVQYDGVQSGVQQTIYPGIVFTLKFMLVSRWWLVDVDRSAYL